MALTDKINDGFRQLTTLVKGKVDKTAVIDVAHGGTGAITISSAQTALGVDKVVSANTRLTTAKQTFPNVFVDSNGQLQKTQLATWLDHAKMYNGLVPNGSFQMGDATGWKLETSRLLTLDTTDFPFGAQGCLRCAGGSAVSLILDKLPVNPFMKYRYSIMYKYEKVNTPPSFFVGMASYDVDGNTINSQHALNTEGTITTLAQDLKIGDTKVYLTSLSNWIPTTPSYASKGFKFFTYTDSRGFLYKANTIPYSRYIATNGTNGWWAADAASFNISENSITLVKPWDYANPKDSNGTWFAGTSVAQPTSTGTYQYNLVPQFMKNQVGNTDWLFATIEIEGFGTSNKNFWAGTASIAPVILFNNAGTSTGDVTKVSNLYFEKI